MELVVKVEKQTPCKLLVCIWDSVTIQIMLSSTRKKREPLQENMTPLISDVFFLFADD